MDKSPVIKIAAFTIIIAGLIFAKSIINPFLLAMFVSIICVQSIAWLEKKRMPKWLALFSVMLGLVILFSGFAFLIGGTLSSFSGNVSKYESQLTTILNSFVQFLNEKGLVISKDQVSNFFQPARILEYTAGAVNEVLNMMGNTFLIFLIILFILMESGSFPV
jgi:AI-2 transport protein TqsA